MITVKKYAGPEDGANPHDECGFVYSQHGTVEVPAAGGDTVQLLVCPTTDGPFSGEQVTELGWRVAGHLLAEQALGGGQ